MRNNLVNGSARPCLLYLKAPRLQYRSLSLAYAMHQPRGGVVRRNPLVFLHGLFGSKQNNRSIILAQALNATVYALDLRNHGESPHHTSHDYLDMADDVEEFLQHHEIQHPILLGHSMGAKVAMTVALRSPDLLRALVSIDNAPVDANLGGDFFKYVEGLREIHDSAPLTQAEADKILSKYEQDLNVRQFLLTNLVRSPHAPQLRLRIPVKILGDSLGHIGDFPFKNPAHHSFRGPALFIRGARSPYIADDVLPLIGQFFPRFVLKSIDSGHWVISENPKDFELAVTDFVQTIDEGMK